jgi:hypothetical protein
LEELQEKSHSSQPVQLITKQNKTKQSKTKQSKAKQSAKLQG